MNRRAAMSKRPTRNGDPSAPPVAPAGGATHLPYFAPPPRYLPTERPGPVGGKRDENRRRRTEEIAAAAQRLFLARGVLGVTIDDIVREAAVAKGSFYRYFR